MKAFKRWLSKWIGTVIVIPLPRPESGYYVTCEGCCYREFVPYDANMLKYDFPPGGGWLMFRGHKFCPKCRPHIQKAGTYPSQTSGKQE